MKGAAWTEIMSVRTQFMPGVVLGGLLVFTGYLYYAAAVFRHLLVEFKPEPYQVGSAKGFMATLHGMP